MSSENKEKKEKSLIGKILFVVGVVVILIILAFLVITFVPRIFSGLANVGSSLGSLVGGNTIEITADKTTLKDGDRFTLVWEDKPEEIGSYNITYECIDDVYFDIITDTDVRRLICENTFTLGQVDNATLRIHFDKENGYADVPIYITFSDGESITKRGAIEVNVQKGNPLLSDSENESISPEAAEEGDNSNAEITSEVTQSNTNTATQNSQTVTPTTNYTQTQQVAYQPRVVSPADLAISNITAFGNNQLQFTVTNIGGQSSGNWVFNYSAPTNNAQVATSPLQVSLAPGQAIRYTLNYFVRDGGTQTVSVAVDPANQIAERNENNNFASATFSTGVPVGTNSGNNGGGVVTNPPVVSGNDDADFRIEDLEVGRLNGNRFIEDDRLEEDDDMAIRFVVRNIGDRTTNDWRFRIEDLPFDRNDTYESGRYNGLRPGAFTEVIVSFDDIERTGDFDIEVYVDSEDDTDEESESNNQDSVELEVER